MALLHDFDRRQKRPPSKQEAIELAGQIIGCVAKN